MVKRTDFRPRETYSKKITEKDRMIIRDNRMSDARINHEYHQIALVSGHKEAERHIKTKYGAGNYDIKEAKKYHQEQLSKIESKEHPSLSSKESEQLVKDHLKENPDYYASNKDGGVRYIIHANKWFDKKNGNTYHKVRITDAKTNKLVYESPITYGYGTQYEHTAKDYLIKTGRMNENDRFNHEQNRKHLYISESEVQRQRDL